MSCIGEGKLRAFVDHELTREESESVHAHLRSCARCSGQAERLAEEARQVHALLSGLAPHAAQGPIDAGTAYRGYREAFGPRLNNTPRGQRFLDFWRAPVFGGIATACALALLLSFAPVRSWGQKVLQMLRVQKLAVIPVDVSSFGAEGGHEALGNKIEQLISNSVIVTMKPGEPTRASSAEDASAMAGFRVRTLDNLGSPEQVLVGSEGAFHTTLDYDRIRAVVDQAGRSDIRIPSSIDGSTIAVHIPKSVHLLYGNCSSREASSAKPNSGPAPVNNNGTACVEFLQVPSPTVSVPPTLNMSALAEAGLELTGMSAAEAHTFCQTVDWSSTLVIPIPQRGSTYRTVPVDGVSADLIEMPPHGNFVGRATLVWVKNGMVYSLTGRGNENQVLSAAASLN